MADKQPRFTYRLVSMIRPEQADALRKLAYGWRVSIAAIIRDAIDEYVEKHVPQKEKKDGEQ